MLPLQSFTEYVDQHQLFNSKSNILLAVSGGKDSVLMAHLFKEAGYDFGIVHCNFNLRADESQRDENFVKMLASNFEAPFFVAHFDTKAYAAQHKVSTQMAARALRYEWFEQVRVDNDYDCIAIAHHQGDVIETMLLNLIRGTGIAGLHGILPKRGYLVRPMLFLSRAAIDLLISKLHLDFVEDSSNSTINYARNKIRHQVVPVLQTLNPKLEQTFERNAQRLGETELVLQQVVSSLSKNLLKSEHGTVRLSIQIVKHLNPQRLLFSELLKPYGFKEALADEILKGLDKQSGTIYQSVTHQALIDRDDLIISKLKEVEETDITLIHHQETTVVFKNQQLHFSFSEIIFFEKDKAKAFVDARLLIYPLVLRSRQEGDKFIPIGMSSYKKLSNFLIDEKVPLNEKDQVPILLNGNGEVIWVAGQRQDDRYKIVGGTRQVAIFELKKIHNS
ncbi:tRNA lysidine(34) synthetase TilS [Pedobacter sp. PWIIR3]